MVTRWNAVNHRYARESDGHSVAESATEVAVTAPVAAQAKAKPVAESPVGVVGVGGGGRHSASSLSGEAESRHAGLCAGKLGPVALLLAAGARRLGLSQRAVSNMVAVARRPNHLVAISAIAVGLIALIIVGTCYPADSSAEHAVALDPIPVLPASTTPVAGSPGATVTSPAPAGSTAPDGVASNPSAPAGDQAKPSAAGGPARGGADQGGRTTPAAPPQNGAQQTPPATSAAIYRISGLAGKCIGAAYRNTNNGTPIDIYRCVGDPTQQWTTKDGTIRTAGKCMDVAGGGVADGTRVQLRDCTGASSQQWARSGGQLINVKSNKCLDITDSNPADYTVTELWTCNGGANQQWAAVAW